MNSSPAGLLMSNGREELVDFNPKRCTEKKSTYNSEGVIPSNDYLISRILFLR
jgi:hypothetical protein